jgi:hypothetical protein
MNRLGARRKDEWISGFRWGVAVTFTALVVLGLLKIVS